MRRRTLIITVALVCSAGVCGGAAHAAAGSAPHGAGGCALPRFGPGATYHPHIEARDFGPHVDNPWFPLRPGTTFIYAGEEDGVPTIDVVAPSHRTRVIDGVRTRVVLDRLLKKGRVVERTTDYYAQDRCGNVWYFGEDTAELDRHGRVVSREGSWHAGVRGAQPGVYMQARPTIGRRFRQEWSPGNAADQFSVIAKHADVRTPYGSFDDALRTRETSELEPGVVDNKLYVRGIGDVLEVTVTGGNEKLSLVDVLH
jgi:hypothetical protein